MAQALTGTRILSFRGPRRAVFNLELGGGCHQDRLIKTRMLQNHDLHSAGLSFYQANFFASMASNRIFIGFGKALGFLSWDHWRPIQTKMPHLDGTPLVSTGIPSVPDDEVGLEGPPQRPSFRARARLHRVQQERLKY